MEKILSLIMKIISEVIVEGPIELLADKCLLVTVKIYVRS
ncbi:MAG: hypothetical protein H6Q73_1593 [Firmicutes bacterium]|nr:hypothetical protein [Bacillota bacterium]